MQKSKLTLFGTYKTLLYCSRPISWINTCYPFVAAYLATGGKSTVFFWLAAFYFLIPYNILIYVINDVFDYDSDVKNPRKNSIEGGLLAPELHGFMLRSAAAITCIFGIPLILISSPVQAFVLVLIMIGAVIYSVPPLRTKERPFVDSITSSFHFVSPMIFAFLVTGFEQSYLGYVLAFFLWGCASHMFGAVQDILPDRKAGIDSIATLLGAKTVVRLSLVLYICSVVLLALYGWPQVGIAAVLLMYPLIVLPFWNLTDKNSNQANAGWGKFLIANQITGACITIALIGSAVRG